MDAAQPVLWAAETANVTPDIVKLYDQKHPAAAAPVKKQASDTVLQSAR